MKLNKTIDQLITSARRELAMRKKVYPNSQMNKAEQSHEIDCMKEIVRFLESWKLIDMGMAPDSLRFDTGPVERFQLILNPEIQQRLTAQGMEKVNVLLVYVDGVLESMGGLSSISRTSPNTLLTLQAINRLTDREQVEKTNHLDTWKYIPLETLQVQQRIAMFCTAFKHHFNRSYKVSGQEAGMWNSDKYRDLVPTTDQLAYYMAEEMFPLNGAKTIRDFLTHYAAIDQMKDKYQVDEDGLPGMYNRKVYNDLMKNDPPMWQRYRTKLTKLGYIEMKHPKNGKFWTKP